MEAIRVTMNSTVLESIMDLPEIPRGREVEVIVQPVPEEPKDRPKRKSMMGCLHEYANPALREQEKGAWERAAVEKYSEKKNDGHS